MATAVIRTGAKQYRVAAGDVVQIEKLVGNPGDDVVFSEVLAVGDDTMKFGSPLVAGASVKAKIVSQDLGDKLIVFKDGAMVEEGTQEQLLARGGVFAELYRLHTSAPATITAA